MTTQIIRIDSDTAARWCKSLDLSTFERRAMDYCFVMSELMWAGTIDGKLAAVWGLIPATIMSNQAYLWLYTTDVLKEHSFILVRHSQLVMEEMLKAYPSIVGHAVVGNNKAIRWLKWLGAKFGDPQGDGLPFRINRSG